MPLTKSAKKALRVDRDRKAINDATRNKVKSALKAARLAIDAGDKDAKAKIDATYRELDLAAKKNVIHKNKASRLKSRLAKKAARTIASSQEKKPAKKTAVKKILHEKTSV